jgi:hypothetical protein
MYSYTTIRLKKSTVEELKKLGKKGETYDEIITKLIKYVSKAAK